MARLTPQDFGALGDDSTDDAVAIQAWLNSQKALELPVGKYRYSVKPQILNNGIDLIGEGDGAVLRPTYTNDDALGIGPNLSHINLEKFAIDPVGTMTSGAAIRVAAGCNTVGIEKIHILKGYDGIVADGGPGSANLHLGKSVIHNCTRYATFLGATGLMTDVYLSDLAYALCGEAIRFKHASGIYASRINSILSTNATYRFAPGAGEFVAFGFFDTVLADSSINGSGWLYQPISTGIVSNIVGTNCWAAGNKLQGYHIKGLGVSAVSYTNSISRNNFQHGVHAEFGSDFSWSHGQIGHNSLAGNGLYHGFVVGIGFDELDIEGGFIGEGGFDKAMGMVNKQGFGVLFNGTGQNNIQIHDVDLRGNVNGGMIGQPPNSATVRIHDNIG